MTTLITQLENLKGPSREVDAEIAKAMGWKSFTWEFAGRCGLTWYAPLNSVGRPQPPNYTGSIDAALTLMPKINRPNFPWLAIKSNNPNNPIGCRCELWLDNVKNYNGRGETLAIAICIAALKAREVANET